MNILFSCIGRRSYIIEYFRAHLDPKDKIIGTSNTKWTQAFKDCDIAIVLPDIVDDDYIPTLLQVCQDQKIDAILSFFDPDIDVLSHHREEFRTLGVMPVLPNAELSDICFDKYKTYQFLKQRGFPTPKTYINLDNAINDLNIGDIAFPLIVKPRHGFASLNLFTARDEHELRVFFNYVPDMIVQEKLVGDQYDFDLLTDFDGELLAVVPWNKITSRAGEVDRATTSKDESLMEFGVQFGNELGKNGHVGPLDSDLFVIDDQIYIVEMNPRFGGGYPMSHLAGADFPKLIVRMLRGEQVKPEIGNFSAGVIMMKEYKIFGGRPADYFDKIINLKNRNTK